jgi:hypothetical protein
MHRYSTSYKQMVPDIEDSAVISVLDRGESQRWNVADMEADTPLSPPVSVTVSA